MPEARAGAGTCFSRASAPSQADLCVDNGAGNGVNKGANRRAAESGHAVDTQFKERGFKEESLERGALLPLPPSSQPPSQRSYSLRAKTPNPKYSQQVPAQDVQGSRSNAPSPSWPHRWTRASDRWMTPTCHLLLRIQAAARSNTSDVTPARSRRGDVTAACQAVSRKLG